MSNSSTKSVTQVDPSPDAPNRRQRRAAAARAAPLTLSVFRGRDPHVAAEHTGPWSDFVAALPAQLDVEARDKLDLPAITCCAFANRHRSNAEAGAHTALLIDVDVIPDLPALLRACSRWRCVAYESPSSTDELPRLRVIAALAEPYPAHAAPEARAAFARELGLDPAICGVSRAASPAQIMFIGRVEGTRPRKISVFDGEVWAPPTPGAEPARATHSEARPALSYGPERIPDLAVLSREIGQLDARGMRRGGRHVARAIGGYLARRGYHPDAIYAAVFALPSSQPDVRAEQARDTAEQWLSGDTRAAGFAALDAHFGEAVTAELDAATQDPWIARMIDLLPTLRRKSLPVVDAFSGPARDFIVAQREEMRTPIALNVGAALATLQAAIAGHVRVELGPNWVSETGLYVCCVAPSGGVKSPVYKMAIAPIKAWVAERQDADREELQRKMLARADLEMRKKALEKARAQAWGEYADAPDDADLLQVRIALAAPEPVPFEMLIEDATPEVVVNLLAQHGRIACFTSEGAKVFAMLGGKHDAKGQPDMSAWLQAYDGELPKVHRIGREAAQPRHQHTTLSALIMTQPTVMQRVATNPDMLGEGLVPRLTWIIGHSTGPRWSPGELPTAVPAPVLEAWEQVVRRMLDIPPGTTVRLGAEAHGVQVQWRDELEQRMQDDLSGSMAAWASKHLERTARIAAGLWACDGAAGREITADQMRRAVVIGRWLIDHAKQAVIGGRAEAQRNALDAKVLARLAEDRAPMTRRDVGRNMSAKQLAGLDDALARLVEAGAVVVQGERLALP